MVAIRGFGGYIPRYRIERTTVAEQFGDPPSSGELAVPGPDESVLTMAVAAAKTALDHADLDGVDVDAVFVATTTDPFDERGLAAHVGFAIGAGRDVRVADFQGSARASGNAVQSALDAVTAGSVQTVLVVGTDIVTAGAGTPSERFAGAGAGALVLGPKGAVGTITNAVQETTGFVGRFKRAGEDPVPGDGRFVRKHGYLDAVNGALDALGAVSSAGPDHTCFPAPMDGWGARALRTADLDVPLHTTFPDLGYIGTAQPLLDLALALEAAAAEDVVWVACYGPGGCDILEVRMGPSAGDLPDPSVSALVADKTYVPYAKHRQFRTRAEGEA